VQSVRSHRPHYQPVPLAVAVRRAREAWIAGDYETTLLRLDEADDYDAVGELRDDCILLRARALYRMLRYADVIDELRPVITTFTSPDATATARMLLGTALARSGDGNDGLRELAEAAGDAEASQAHRAVQAELAHARALAYWLRGDYDLALRFAAAAERANVDVISVRAAQLRGFIAVSRQKFPEALRLFRSTLDRYRSCRERDDSLVEQTVLQVASLELTLRSASESGSHRSLEARRVRPWDPFPSRFSSTACAQRMALDGWLYALDGDAVTALALMREADELAPTPAWRVWTLAQRAGLTLGFGEANSARDVAGQAQAFVRDVDWEATGGEERVGLLLLAEVLTWLAPASAPALLARYDGLPPLSRNHVLAGDPRQRALELHVRGMVARAAGNIPEALTMLKEAVREWRAVGNLWRTSLALIELDATIAVGSSSHSAHRTPSSEFYLEAATLIVQEHFPRSFLSYRIGGWLRAYNDPVTAALAPHKRHVLRLVLAGLDNKQIATRLGLRYNSVRSYVAELHAAFGTHSDRELFADCVRRGITGPPGVPGTSGMHVG
jgi:DNA-binding NarL/FixJ family response regulator